MALTLTLVAALTLPGWQTSRESAISSALKAFPITAPTDSYDAQALCADWAALPADELDCRNGLELKSLTHANNPDQAIAWEKGLKNAREKVERFNSLASLLREHTETQETLSIQLVLQRRIEAWRERLTQLDQGESAKPMPGDFARLFQLTLELDGMTYDASRNRFRKVNWHLARLTDTEPSVIGKAEDLKMVRTLMPWSLGVITAALLLVGWRCARWSGLMLMAGTTLVMLLGLLIVADAAVRFGEGSTLFALNPLGNQLTRQFQVLWIGACTIAATALLAPRMGAWIVWPQRHLWVTMLLFLGGTGAAYLLMGSAMGAELLKISTAFLSGLVTAAHGRGAHLAAEFAPRALHLSRILKCWRIHVSETIDADDLIAHHLGKPVFQLVAFAGLGLTMAALVFQDLGAALVTAVLAACALFLVLGARIMAIVTAMLSLAAGGLSQTDKVQSRIALMLDPMNASISDFARLLAFSNAAHDKGFALGKMAWCNPTGVCVPLQSLSDYMPVILTGVLGFNATVFYFGAFLAVLIFMGRAMMREYLVQQGATRTMAIITLYLLICVGAQTIITFLGNWRIIPLTGIGAPLLSIGLSSWLTPCLALGLFLAVQRAKTVTLNPRLELP